ncbi:MAG TPA: hypothetical protein VJH65_03960 [Candidatus Nanoarchaeia archaeon]|nr:hypothetical protein [Candidatus Nanoarchaeia archaeon]
MLNLIDYIIAFLIFGVVGWAIDSSYRSIFMGRFVSGTHFKFFSVIYAIGSIILIKKTL